ncbi:MAG: SUF system NifU family Fe-S cluster assembly protein [Defluviitaleaceae bacterium]|nr:SUF system NifU family Fe-S cluster assembly protein [Defluviitaleaceae bacterium]
MAFSNLEGLYRQVIMDHYKDPRNKGLPTDESYHHVHLKNPSCGDDITVAIKLEGDTIEDIRHEGVGCSICCSSASVMCEELCGKDIVLARRVTHNFYEIVKGSEIDETIDMGDAIAYSGVSNFPARIKCATIPWKALETGLEELGK